MKFRVEIFYFQGTVYQINSDGKNNFQHKTRRVESNVKYVYVGLRGKLCFRFYRIAVFSQCACSSFAFYTVHLLVNMKSVFALAAVEQC